jgi:hypothetical protein
MLARGTIEVSKKIIAKGLPRLSRSHAQLVRTIRDRRTMFSVLRHEYPHASKELAMLEETLSNPWGLVKDRHYAEDLYAMTVSLQGKFSARLASHVA